MKYDKITSFLSFPEGFQDVSLPKAFTIYFQVVTGGEFTHQTCPVKTMFRTYSSFSEAVFLYFNSELKGNECSGAK